MLRLINLMENFDLAKEALKIWEHDDDTLDEMMSNFCISSNAIYPYCHKVKLDFCGFLDV